MLIILLFCLLVSGTPCDMRGDILACNGTCQPTLGNPGHGQEYYYGCQSKTFCNFVLGTVKEQRTQCKHVSRCFWHVKGRYCTLGKNGAPPVTPPSGGGGGGVSVTVTVVLQFTEPPGPLAVPVYVVVSSGKTDFDPDAIGVTEPTL